MCSKSNLHMRDLRRAVMYSTSLNIRLGGLHSNVITIQVIAADMHLWFNGLKSCASCMDALSRLNCGISSIVRVTSGLSLHPCTHPWISFQMSRPIHLSIHLSIHPSFSPSTHPSFHPSTEPSTHPSFSPSILPTIH